MRLAFLFFVHFKMLNGTGPEKNLKWLRGLVQPQIRSCLIASTAGRSRSFPKPSLVAETCFVYI